MEVDGLAIANAGYFFDSLADEAVGSDTLDAYDLWTVGVVQGFNLCMVFSMNRDPFASYDTRSHP